jgi:hypothetical protein
MMNNLKNSSTFYIVNIKTDKMDLKKANAEFQH